MCKSPMYYLICLQMQVQMQIITKTIQSSLSDCHFTHLAIINIYLIYLCVPLTNDATFLTKKVQLNLCQERPCSDVMWSYNFLSQKFYQLYTLNMKFPTKRMLCVVVIVFNSILFYFLFSLFSSCSPFVSIFNVF